MKKKILNIIEGILGKDMPIELSVTEEAVFGHFSTNLAMRVAKAEGKKPMDLAQEFATAISEKAPAGFFKKVEAAAPGFVNLWLTDAAIQKEFQEVIGDENYGANDSIKGKTVMVEFTDVNPFKQVHVGHLMSNAIGESIARLYEASGAKIVRVNYQSDVGLHVAMGIWAMMGALKADMPGESISLFEKMAYLGKAYAAGSRAHRGEDPAHPGAKEEIEAINLKVYDRSDLQVNALYDLGRKWSLDYFETLYARLGTKFVHYFFESEVGRTGLEIIAAHPDIFEKSEGAIIFRGENYGLHTRVFVNSKGLPVYEGKELGLNRMKFDLYHPDFSVIITGNEINDYFKVLMKVMELTIPDVAEKTKHVPHGMLRLPSGKMSSRTGDVITAESLLDQIKTKLRERVSERADELSDGEREAATEAIAVGAIKYSILKQSPGQDIIFDFEKSLSFEGDSGPYLQYAYARLKSILRKANHPDFAEALRNKQSPIANLKLERLDSEYELVLMRRIFEFPDIISRAIETRSSSGLANYLHKLAVAANKFYETTPIIKDENESRRNARLMLTEIAARTLKSGLGALGVETLEKI